MQKFAVYDLPVEFGHRLVIFRQNWLVATEVESFPYRGGDKDSRRAAVEAAHRRAEALNRDYKPKPLFSKVWTWARI